MGNKGLNSSLKKCSHLMFDCAMDKIVFSKEEICGKQKNVT